MNTKPSHSEPNGQSHAPSPEDPKTEPSASSKKTSRNPTTRPVVRLREENSASVQKQITGCYELRKAAERTLTAMRLAMVKDDSIAKAAEYQKALAIRDQIDLMIRLLRRCHSRNQAMAGLPLHHLPDLAQESYRAFVTSSKAGRDVPVTLSKETWKMFYGICLYLLPEAKVVILEPKGSFPDEIAKGGAS